jgi:hypothetical protein
MTKTAATSRVDDRTMMMKWNEKSTDDEDVRIERTIKRQRRSTPTSAVDF